MLSVTHTRTLRSNFGWNAVGCAVFALSQWGILVVFAKLGNPILVGQLVYGIALTTPLFVVTGLQLRSIQATDAENRHTLGQYLGLRLLTTIVAVIISGLVAVATRAAGNQAAPIILPWALSKAFDSGSDALYGLFQQSERMDYVGVSMVVRGLLGVASVAILFRTSHSSSLTLAGLVVCWGAVFILFDIHLARTLLRQRARSANVSNGMTEALRPVIDRRQLTPLFLEAAPLGVVAFLLSVEAQIPRYVVAGLLHTRELGLFSAAAYLTFIGATLVNALAAPASVRLAQYNAAGARSSIRRLITKLLLVAAVLGIASIWVSACFGRQILTLLYTHEYSQMAGVLTMLCVCGAVSYVASFLGYGMTALRCYKIQVPIFAVVVLLTVVSCYYLTERYGLMGTAVGMLIGNSGQLLMSAAVVWRMTRENSVHTARVTKPANGAEELA